MNEFELGLVDVHYFLLTGSENDIILISQLLLFYYCCASYDGNLVGSFV